MTAIAVRLILDLIQDRRLSMENYAEELKRTIRGLGDPAISVYVFRPEYIAPQWLPRAWRDRWARYRGFPMQVQPRAHGIDHIVDHGYAHLLGVLRPETTVVTAHDIIPLLAGRGLLAGGRRKRPWLSEFSAGFLRRAGAIVAVSANTKRDLVEHLGVREERIHVVPNGLSDEFRILPDDRTSLRRELSLAEEKVLVLITGNQFYKNHRTSVRVLKRLRESHRLDAELVCMGVLSSDARELAERHGLAGFISSVRPPDKHSLLRLYNAVDCLLFPSLYEGFGWPVLEAMACGTPVVCSNAGSLLEVAGDAALTAEPLDATGLAEHASSLILDDERRRQMIALGVERSRRFSWESHARGVVEVYRRLA